MNPSPTLLDSQRWLLTVMTASQGAEAGLALAAQAQGLTLEDMIMPPPRGDARARVAVYAGGYLARLLACLRADFPLLARVMGDEVFDFFARRYLHHCPSRSTTLYDLGARFADFLAASQPPSAEPHAELALPVALARLERAYVECLRAPGLEHAALGMADWWRGLDARAWRLAPCVALDRCGHGQLQGPPQGVGLDEGTSSRRSQTRARCHGCSRPGPGSFAGD